MQLRIFKFLLLIAITTSTYTVTAGSMPTEFTTLHNIYTDQVAKLKNVRDNDLDDIAPGYLDDLKRLETHYQASGDLEPLIIVRKEYTRFQKNQRIDEVISATSPAGLTKLQDNLLVTQKSIKLKCADSIIDLGENYKNRLNALKKKLTKDGKIEDALKIMSEIDDIESYPDIMTAHAQSDAGGTLDIARRKPSKRPSDTKLSNNTENSTPTRIRKLTKESLADYFHTKITRWNSATREITCNYSFTDENQLQAWSNASFDKLRHRLLCDKVESWLTPTFSSVRKIEFDAHYFSGDGPIRVMLGKSLYADLEPTTNGKAVLHQGNASYPIAKSFGGAEPYVRYHNELNIDGWDVQWTVGKRTLEKKKLLKPISKPIKIGLGSKESKVMYSNITITGVLSPATIKAIQGR